MKKTVTMLLILVLMFTLIGCGSEKTEQEKIVKMFVSDVKNAKRFVQLRQLKLKTILQVFYQKTI